MMMWVKKSICSVFVKGQIVFLLMEHYNILRIVHLPKQTPLQHLTTISECLNS